MFNAHCSKIPASSKVEIAGGISFPVTFTGIVSYLSKEEMEKKKKEEETEKEKTSPVLVLIHRLDHLFFDVFYHSVLLCPLRTAVWQRKVGSVDFIHADIILSRRTSQSVSRSGHFS